MLSLQSRRYPRSLYCSIVKRNANFNRIQSIKFQQIVLKNQKISHSLITDRQICPSILDFILKKIKY